MTEKKNARPTAPTAGQAVENGTDRKTAHVSTYEFTTPAAGRQIGLIADLLLCGAENAISRRDLMALTGYKDRELRLLIEAERRQGIPILSDCVGGYFLPASEAERQQCVRSLRRRAKEIENTATAIEQAEV